MRKALNFDLDTKEYEKYTKRKAPTAYYEIKKFLLNKNFEHRQGSGYISKESLNDVRILVLIENMTKELKWLKKCVKQIDITNIGKQHSMIDTINKTPLENDFFDIEL